MRNVMTTEQGSLRGTPWLVSLLVAAVAHLALPDAWFVLAGTLAWLAGLDPMPWPKSVPSSSMSLI